MADVIQTIAERCVQIQKASSWTEARGCLQSFAEALGASYFLFGVRTGKRISPPEQVIVSNYPKAWQNYYDGHGAFAYDPVFLKSLQMSGTFRWDGLHKDEKQLLLRQESIRNGMEFGISCPDLGADSSMAILSFCGNKPIATEHTDWETFATSVALYTATTHKVIVRIIENRRAQQAKSAAPLTESEARALELMAGGNTLEEAATDMRVTERTVRYYLDRAAVKLGVPTRKEALLKALAGGIIDVRRFPTAGFSSTETHS